MLRRQGPALALTALISLAALAGWQSSTEPSRQLSYDSHANSTNYKPTEYYPFNRFGEWVTQFWGWSTHDPVAFFTFVLAIFTGSLVIVSGIQIRYLRRADETARTAADAAKA